MKLIRFKHHKGYKFGFMKINTHYVDSLFTDIIFLNDIEDTILTYYIIDNLRYFEVTE